MSFDFKTLFENQGTATPEQWAEARLVAENQAMTAEHHVISLQAALRKAPEEEATLTPQIEAAKIELEEARALASAVEGMSIFFSDRSQVRVSQRTC